LLLIQQYFHTASSYSFPYIIFPVNGSFIESHLGESTLLTILIYVFIVRYLENVYSGHTLHDTVHNIVWQYCIILMKWTVLNTKWSFERTADNFI